VSCVQVVWTCVVWLSRECTESAVQYKLCDYCNRCSSEYCVRVYSYVVWLLCERCVILCKSTLCDCCVMLCGARVSVSDSGLICNEYPRCWRHSVDREGFNSQKSLFYLNIWLFTRNKRHIQYIERITFHFKVAVPWQIWNIRQCMDVSQ
jgi:hypothetical protein